MSDIRVLVRCKNARIMRAMERAGISTQAELARMAGLAENHLCALINLRKKPIGKNGSWSKNATDLATALHCDEEDLWPGAMRDIEAKKREVSFDVSQEQLATLATDKRENLSVLVNEALGYLPAREKLILEMRFGLHGNGAHGLHEVGEVLGITQERVRQIEHRAMRRIQSKWARQ